MILSRKNLFGTATALGAAAVLGGVAARAADLPVVGAWKLVSFEVDEPNGRKPRFGPHPAGYLTYTSSGKVSAVLSGLDRAALRSPVGPSAQASCVQSVADFLAYAGSYEVRGDRVFHHVEVSVFTTLIGTTLERQFTIQGDTLTIKTLPPEIWGGSNVLVWKRA